jgi:hypothetical protein
VGPSDPPPLTTDMIEVVVDADGRLLTFTAVPPEALEDTAADTVATDTWDLLFDAARLDRAAFTPTGPSWLPSVYATERRAWQDNLVTAGHEVSVTVEAAAAGDRVVSFRVHGPWFAGNRTVTRPTLPDGSETVMLVIIVAVLAAAVTLAVRNHRRGRTDLRGAGRLAAFLLAMPVIHWIFGSHHAPLPMVLLDRFFDVLAVGALYALFCLTLYLAIEPVVRRIWPSILIGWSRLLSGGWRDPMVGRSILFGGAMFGIESLVGALHPTFMKLMGAPPDMPAGVDFVALATPRALAGLLAVQVPNALFNVLFFLMMLVLLRLLLRRPWPAYLAFGLLTMTILAVQMPDWRTALLAAPVMAVLWSVVLIRGGLLAFAVAFYLGRVFAQAPLTLDFSQAYAATSLAALAVATGLLLAGLAVALGGRSLLRDDVPFH